MLRHTRKLHRVLRDRVRRPARQNPRVRITLREYRGPGRMINCDGIPQRVRKRHRSGLLSPGSAGLCIYPPCPCRHVLHSVFRSVRPAALRLLRLTILRPRGPRILSASRHKKDTQGKNNGFWCSFFHRMTSVFPFLNLIISAVYHYYTESRKALQVLFPSCVIKQAAFPHPAPGGL